MSTLEPTLEPERLVRRIEVITSGGRRRWTVDEKARIVSETLESGAVDLNAFSIERWLPGVRKLDVSATTGAGAAAGLSWKRGEAKANP